MEILEAIETLPKVEQHVHLLGSIRPTTLMKAIDESNIDSDYSSLEELEKQFVFKDFHHFLSVYLQAIMAIRDEKYFESMAYELLESCSQSNVKYVEMSFSASDHIEMGLDFDRTMKSIEKGIERGRKKFGVLADIRIDLVRSSGLEYAMSILDMIDNRPEGIVSIDLGGPEKEFPPDIYVEAYDRARKMGLHLVAHAGEAAGPESIWGAVDKLGAEHIGHGVTAIRDPLLIDHLKQKGVTIETCPISNVRTRVVDRIENHPIRTFFEKKVSLSVNSDDPSFFNTDMNNEYQQLHNNLGFSIENLYQISRDSLESSFLELETKTKLLRAFEVEYEKIIQSLR